jgi:hypothetical protein
MNIKLYIDRLILDGISLSFGGRPMLQAAIEAELMRLLTHGSLKDTLQSGGALYNVSTTGIQLVDDGSPTQLGEQIARAVYGGIGQ